QEKESSDQRDRDRQGGDQRGTPVPEEQKDHQGDKHKCLEQGVEHLLDGGLQKAGDVVADLVGHAWREALLLELLELPLDLLDDGGGIGAGKLLENDRSRRIAVDIRVKVVERRAQLDFGNVPDPQDLAVRIGL